jgi:hypothetical protein
MAASSATQSDSHGLKAITREQVILEYGMVLLREP